MGTVENSLIYCCSMVKPFSSVDVLRSYFLWRNFILLPGETEKGKWAPHRDRQNKCHSPHCHQLGKTRQGITPSASPGSLSTATCPAKLKEVPAEQVEALPTPLAPCKPPGTRSRAHCPAVLEGEGIAKLTWPERVWVRGRATLPPAPCCL